MSRSYLFCPKLQTLYMPDKSFEKSTQYNFCCFHRLIVEYKVPWYLVASASVVSGRICCVKGTWSH